jgi:hypothetical protein
VAPLKLIRCPDRLTDPVVVTDKSVDVAVFGVMLSVVTLLPLRFVDIYLKQQLLNMSCEIKADSITCTGQTRRTIPILHRYSTASINVPHAAGTLVTSNSVLASQNVSTTGFEYQNGLYRNTSGKTLVCLVSYAVLWTSISAGGRLSWIQLDNETTRYAMSSFASTTSEPCGTGSEIIIVPHNSYLRLWVFQDSGFTLNLVGLYGMPYLKITII